MYPIHTPYEMCGCLQSNGWCNRYAWNMMSNQHTFHASSVPCDGQSVLCHTQWTGKLPFPPHITSYTFYTFYTFYASILCQVLRDATEAAIHIGWSNHQIFAVQWARFKRVHNELNPNKKWKKVSQSTANQRVNFLILCKCGGHFACSDVCAYITHSNVELRSST